jgi:carbamoyltransferase
MLILGITGGYKREDEDNQWNSTFHDSAAALVKDGEILSAIEEERLNRIKHSNTFPANAIRHCLNEHELGFGDIDFIATNFEESTVDGWAKANFLADASIMARNGRGLLAALFEHEYGVDIADKLRFCKHHIAHAWSAYGPSGYDDSLILVLDGMGDNESGMVLLGEDSKLTVLREYNIHQSLGMLYSRLINFIGYNRFDEYKAMGLAPYGDPSTYSSLFERCYRLLPEGNYALESIRTWFRCMENIGLLSIARRKGEPFNQAHKDVAAALQAALEKIVLHILEYYKNATGQKFLCMAGGVAHNCTMNGKILYSGLFEKVFIQPAAHDAGTALGAALSVWNEKCPSSRGGRLNHLYWGTDVSDDSKIGKTLSKWKTFLSYERVDNIAKTAANLLTNGAVIGWVQGRSEFGPRALGNRSILADPRPADNKLLINRMVKKREGFRPFAPAVLEEKLHDYFDIPPGRAHFSFMTFVVNVRPEMQGILGAITHIDGTARVQTVSKKINPAFWELIHEFGKLTGIDMVLNTSFNNNVEPIVDSVEEAIACLLTTGIQYLVAGNYLISERRLENLGPVHKSLIPRLPPSRKLVKRKKRVTGGRLEIICELESTANRLFSQRTIQISEETFTLLQAADGNTSIADLTDWMGMSGGGREKQIIQELLDLWSNRALTLQPQ